MGERKLCYGCMERTEFSGGVCPNCGYYDKSPSDPSFIIPGTQLNNRYIVGVALFVNGEGITYLAYDQSIGCKAVSYTHLDVYKRQDGTGGSTDTIKGEFSQNGVENTLSHTRGVVSMARSNDPDSASSQFFICYGDESFLDGQYAAFGKVTEGMDVVDSFVKVERSMGSDGAVSSPNTDIIMENVKMIDDDSDGNPRVEITMNDFLK